MSVRRAQLEISPEEFNEWRAYFSHVEPHGAWRDDLHAGVVAAAVRNSFRGAHDEPFTANDFVLDFDAKPEPAEVVQQAKPDVAAARLHMQMMRMVEKQKRKAGASSPPSVT